MCREDGRNQTQMAEKKVRALRSLKDAEGHGVNTLHVSYSEALSGVCCTAVLRSHPHPEGCVLTSHSLKTE